MKFLSLQHIAIEDPGTFKDFLLADGHTLTTIQLDEGDTIPSNLNEYDAMLCMGGPMDTFMEKEYPWLVPEKKAIGEYVLNLKKPFLGFCLGCQLLGEVLGGRVAPSEPPEIGVLDINIMDDAKQDPVFNFLPNSIKALQWHSYEVQDLEAINGVEVIGSSPSTKYQIFGYNNHAYGIQFHIEIRKSTVDDWAAVPEYKNALEQSLGKEALPEMKNSVNQEIDTMMQQCNQLYKNFINII
ncbi:MAG: type 1 glutamine amidotransferase [alpha proteobacterium HIMB59]|jgi:GMP synthase-like glutamine amidotransferase|nr:MAG: type 1 glutamine amidotransferase [alpha proteobacterium HIMB59]|tara:strand:+ start:1520 stop:2239 length:720 start_codon:yes stop_codon:yes gene_type:complete